MPNAPVLPRERIAHLSYGRRLLRCGSRYVGLGSKMAVGRSPGAVLNLRSTSVSGPAVPQSAGFFRAMATKSLRDPERYHYGAIAVNVVRRSRERSQRK